MKPFRWALWCLAMLAVTVSSPVVRADDFSDFADLDMEALLDTEIVSASRRTQKLSESANAMYVITAEDIKRSGAVDLPDLFRMVPGVDVINVYGNCYGVSARGFNERFGGRMLVMIDGRSIYTPFFGGVFWENEEVFLEDIRQIEVIRGPGATMWGANSVNGVINIITKEPDESRDALLTGRVGTKHFRETVFRYSDAVTERLSVSLTGGFREDEGARGVNDFRRVPKSTARIKYELSDKTTLNLFAGVNESEFGLPLTRYTPETDSNFRSNYQMLRWEHRFSPTSQFHLQFYHSFWAVHSEDKAVDIEERKYDVELQHSFALGSRSLVVWGGNYRTIKGRSSYLRHVEEHDDIIGCFVQDETRLLESVRFVVGIKYEENSFTGHDFSPRACLLYEPVPNHQLRLAVSRAFRTPSFAENGVQLVQSLPQPLPPLPLLVARGNKQLDVEEMIAYELGYWTTIAGRIGLNVEVYYNELDDLVKDVMTRQQWPFQITWQNTYKAIAKGIEIALDIPVTSYWKLTANYTFQDVAFKRINQDYIGSPRHKFNLGANFNPKPGLALDLWVHFVDDTSWNGLTNRVGVDEYVRVDARVAQRLWHDRLEVALVAQNLTDKLHRETFDVVGNYEVDRLIYGQVTLFFR